MTQTAILVEWRGQIVVSTWPPEPTEDEARAFIHRLEGILEQGAPIGLLVDARRLVTVPDSLRELRTSKLESPEARRRSALRGVAVVLSSSVARGLIAALHWMKKPVHPE